MKVIITTLLLALLFVAVGCKKETVDVVGKQGVAGIDGKDGQDGKHGEIG